MKRVLFLTMLAAMLLAACAPATPTADPAQIQASAVAAANTMVAQTQAAMPTETPIPPTPLPSPTPMPSPTLLPLPTLSITASAPQAAPTVASNPGSSSSGGGDPCQAPLAANPAGPQVTVRIINDTKGSVVLSLWLQQKTAFGECGYRGFNLDAGGSATTTLPVGCYGAGAFINDPKHPSKVFGSGCFPNSDTKGTVEVTSDVIRVSQ